MTQSRPVEVMICTNRRYGGIKPSCAERGSEKLLAALRDQLAQRGLSVRLTASVCQNSCERGPTLRLLPGPEIHLAVTMEDLPGLVDRITTMCQPVGFPAPG
jgi:(2Fe-2S) ferredoxin